LRFAKHGKAVIVKLKGDNLSPALERQLTKELSELFPFFLKYREWGVRAWEVALNRGLPEVWRKNSKFLQSLDNIISDTKFDRHIRVGDQVTRSDGTIKSVRGVHSNDAITVSPGQVTFNQGDIRIQAGTKTPLSAGPDDSYQAVVEIFGKVKATPQSSYTNTWRRKERNLGMSTFFPDSWSREKIQNEVARTRQLAIDNSILPDDQGFYSVTNSTGSFNIKFKPDGALDDFSLGIRTAYPN
jgi:hypothetical protein